MRLSKLFGALIILTIPVYSKPKQFKCDCYFSLTQGQPVPKAPKQSNNETLYQDKKFKELLDLCHSNIASGKNIRESIGWLAESSYALAEIESGNGVPDHGEKAYIDSVSDEIAHSYGHARENGPNHWPSATLSRYGNISICATTCWADSAVKNDPNIENFQKRILSVLLRAKQFQKINELITKSGTVPEKISADALLEFSEQYIGFAALMEGAEFLSLVKHRFKVSKTEIRRLESLFKYAAQNDARIPNALKAETVSKISEIFNR